MSDNVTTQSATPATPPASTIIATVEATHSGDTVQAGVGVLAKTSGAEGTRVLTIINPATEDKQDAEAVLVGAVTETAPASDTASSGLNGRLQRIAQRLTSLITALGSPFQSGGSIGNTTFASTQSGTWTVATTNGLSLIAYDYVSLTQASTTDTWVFKAGGAGGTTVATVTITYTDSTKATISTVVKT